MKKSLLGLLLFSHISYGADFTVQFSPEDNSISTVKLQDSSISSLKIQDGAVTASKIADGSIDDSKISLISSSKISDFNSKTKTKYKKKIIPADIGNIGSMELSDLRFVNLEIGKKYKCSFSVMLVSSGDASVVMRHNGVDLATARTRDSGSSTVSGTAIFTATTSTLYFFSNSNASAYVQGTASRSYAILEEVPNHEETTQWD